MGLHYYDFMLPMFAHVIKANSELQLDKGTGLHKNKHLFCVKRGENWDGGVGVLPSVPQDRRETPRGQMGQPLIH